MPLSIVAVMAHPDDIEIHVAGTLALLKDRGCSLHCVVVCQGDLGSMTVPRQEIARIRLSEGMAGAAKLGATYDPLGVGDLRTTYCPETKTKFVEALRRHRADVVITHARADYMADHEITCLLAREACFAASIPNWETPGAPGLEPLAAIPELFYADPTGQHDWTGATVAQPIVVDVTSKMNLKADALACHASQRDWLRSQHGEDNYINSMKDWGRARGKQAGFEFGEGFAQHLGHPFPKESKMLQALGALVWRA